MLIGHVYWIGLSVLINESFNVTMQWNHMIICGCIMIHLLWNMLLMKFILSGLACLLSLVTWKMWKGLKSAESSLSTSLKFLVCYCCFLSWHHIYDILQGCWYSLCCWVSLGWYCTAPPSTAMILVCQDAATAVMDGASWTVSLFQWKPALPW